MNSISCKEISGETPLLNALITLAYHNGKQVSEDDITSGLPLTGGDISIELVPRALAKAGLACRVEQPGKFGLEQSSDIDILPAIVELADGGYLVIVDRVADDYLIANQNLRDAVTRHPVETVLSRAGSLVITALPMLEDLHRRHVGEPHNSHWFWGKFSTQRKTVLDIVLGSLVANLFAVAVSLFSLQVYDRVIPNHSVTTLWVLAAGCGVAILLEAMLRVSRAFLIDHAGRSIELDVSTNLLERLNGMKLSSRPASPGSLVHMVKEFGSVREFFTSASIGSVADIPFVVIFLALIYAIAGPVVWIVIAAMGLIVVPSLLAQKKMLELSKEMQGGSAASSKVLTEIAYHHEQVKANRAEGWFQKKWEEINLLNATKTSQQRGLAAALTYCATATQQTAFVACVVAGVFLVFTGEYTVGTIIAISILSSRTLAPATQLAGTLARWQQVRSSLHGLEELMAAEQERGENRQFTRRQVLNGDIVLEQVEYAHTEDSPAFLNVQDLVIRHQTTVAVLGENGSGKSTLLKVMSGLYSASHGAISIDGLEQRHIDPVDLRRNVGYLPQEVRLFAGTLRDNLLMGAVRTDEQSIADALAFSGLDKLVATNPNGLDLEIIDGGDGLSVGQRQCLGLSRLYLQDPPIVLLDEPTASLDQRLEAQLVKNYQQWLKGRTCVIATHRLPILSVTDRTIVMQNGRIVMDGLTDDVVSRLSAKPTAPQAA